MNYTLAIIANNATQNSSTVNNAGQAWFDVEHPYWGEAPVYFNLETESNQQSAQDFVEAANITTFPTILIVRLLEDGQEIVTRLTGSNLSVAEIKQAIFQVLNDETGIIAENGGAGEFDDTQSGFTPGPFGNLFNLNLPKFFWAAVAIGTAYKSLDSKTKFGQIGFGAASLYATSRHIKNIK